MLRKICVGLGLAMGVGSWAGGHEIVLLVGHNAAGQLKIDADLDHPVEMALSRFPEVPGYFGSDPAFHAAIGDDVAGDLYELSPTASVRFVLLAKDAGMEVFADSGSVYMAVGQTFFIGQPYFDVHPAWNLVNGVPGAVYEMTLKVVDVNGVYSESAPVVVPFAVVPEPEVVGVIGAGMLVMRRRGRR